MLGTPYTPPAEPAPALALDEDPGAYWRARRAAYERDRERERANAPRRALPGAAALPNLPLIYTVAAGKAKDAYRHERRRSAESYEALYAAGGDAALGSGSEDTVADPLVRLVRRTTLLEQLEPLVRFKDKLAKRRAGDGASIFAGLCEGLPHVEVVERVKAEHPQSTLTHDALRQLVSSAYKADPPYVA